MTSMRKLQLLGGASVLALAALVPMSQANAATERAITDGTANDTSWTTGDYATAATGVTATVNITTSTFVLGTTSNTGIWADAGAILTINNGGTILGGGTAPAINQSAAANDSAFILNNAVTYAGGLITVASGSANTISFANSTGTGAITITNGSTSGANAGTISNGGTGNAINLSIGSTFTSTITIANNKGTISASGSGGTAINISVGTSSTGGTVITNGTANGAGTISGGTGGGSAIKFTYLGTGVTTTVAITNTQGTVTSSGTAATVWILGTGTDTAVLAIANGTSGSSTILSTISNTGSGNAILLDQAVSAIGVVTITNYEGGTISTSTSGVAAIATVLGRAANSSTLITNKGTITGGGTGTARVAMDFSASTVGTVNVSNTGIINGAIKLGSVGGTVTLSNGTVNGSITNTGAGTTNFVFSGGSSTAATVVGDLGASGTKIGTVIIGAATSATVTGNIYASGSLIFSAADAALTVGGDSTVTAIAIEAATAGFGTLTITGTTTLTSTGAAIGATAALGTLALNGSGKTVTLASSATVNSLVFSADELLSVNNNLSIGAAASGITTATNNTGTLTFAGIGSVTGGDIGTTAKMLKAVNVGTSGTAVTAAGNIYATTLNFAGDGTLTLTAGKTIGGGASVSTVTATSGSTTAGIGTLVFGHTTTSTLAANVGSSTSYVKKVSITGNGASTLAVATNVKIYSQNGITTDDVAASAAITFAGGNTVVSSSGTAAIKEVEATNITALTFTAGTNQITGDIGSSTTSFKTLTVTAGTTTVTGSAYFDTSASLTGALSISGDFEGTATTVNSGGALTMTGTGKTHTGSLTVASGGTFTPGATTTVTGAFANSGTVALGSNTVTVAGAITGTSGVYTTTVTSTTSGRILATSSTAPVFTTAMTVRPTLSGTAAVSGRKYLLFKNTGTGASVANISVSNAGSGLVRWTVATGGTGTDADGTTAIATSDIYLTATVTDATTLTGVTKAAGTTINPLVNYTGTDSNMIALQNAIQALTSASEVNTAGEKLRPNTNGATTQASVTASNAVSSVVATRMDSVRVAHAGTGASGMNSGDAARGIGVWGQAFGYTGDQGTRSGSDGYDAQTAGMAFGVDAQVIAPVRVGMSFAYGTTGVDDKGTRNGNSTDIDSYLATLYGSYTGTPWYVEGMIQGGKHGYDSTRKVAFTGINQTITGKHDASQYGGRIGAGYPVRVQNMTVTPVASLTYLRLDEDGYTETGGSTALKLNSLSTDSLKSSLGAKFSLETKAGSATLIPEVRANWIHEFEDGAPTQTAAFAAGGSSFTTTGVGPAANAINLGLGLTAALKNNLSLSANYDAEIKDQYVGHTGSLQLRADF